MSDTPQHSLILRAGVMLAGIALLALLGMISSVIIVDHSDGDAAAINMAGSLRMQAWRLAAVAEDENPRDIAYAVQLFEQRLSSPAIVHALPSDPDSALTQTHGQLQQHWHTRMRPLLLPTSQARDYRAHVGDFVGEVDVLVLKLQQQLEQKLNLLGTIQGLCMFLTVILLFMAMYELHSRMLLPLRSLLEAAQHMGAGDFNKRIRYDGNDEFGVVTHAFNAMANDLAALYDQLENRVADKTRELSQSNEALQLLYDISRRVAEGGDSSLLQQRVVETLRQALGNASITLCLSRDKSQTSYRLISTYDDNHPPFCVAPDCTSCEARQSHHTRPALHVFPIGKGSELFGELVVDSGSLSPWQLHAVQTTADILATSFGLDKQAEQARRLLLMEERTVIARELHDSLAQALSYLKIQVSRLHSLVLRNNDVSAMEGVLDELRDGLNSAYRQLRELLTTFRLKLDEPGLQPALINTIEEFTTRSDIQLQLHYTMEHCPLNASEEVHVLQIVREALSNVVRHSQASVADVHCQQRHDGLIEITVRDDGIGLGEQFDRAHHHGLAIMRERAHSLKGDVDIHPASPHGTEVRLVFRPRFLVTPLRPPLSDTGKPDTGKHLPL